MICSGADSANKPAQQIKPITSDANGFSPKANSISSDSTITRSVVAAIRSGL
ncbi:hypothetical protein D3C76_1711090 [compost metagenome]